MKKQAIAARPPRSPPTPASEPEVAIIDCRFVLAAACHAPNGFHHVIFGFRSHRSQKKMLPEGMSVPFKQLDGEARPLLRPQSIEGAELKLIIRLRVAAAKNAVHRAREVGKALCDSQRVGKEHLPPREGG